MKNAQQPKRKPKISTFLRSLKVKGSNKAHIRRELRGHKPNSTKMGAGKTKGNITAPKNKHRNK